MEKDCEYERFYKNIDIFSEYFVYIEIRKNNIIIQVENKSSYTISKTYETNITLKDFQKVKYFTIYDSIKDCFYDIYKPNEDINVNFEEKEDSLIITFPISNKKYPSISFTLKKVQKKLDKESIIEEQNIIIRNLKEKYKEINDKLNWMLDNTVLNINIRKDGKLEKYAFKCTDTVKTILNSIVNTKKYVKKKNECFKLYYNEKMLYGSNTL